MGLLQARAIHALSEGDLAAAEAASSEGARLSREVGDLYYLERMLMNLGVVAMAAGDCRLARRRGSSRGCGSRSRPTTGSDSPSFLRQLGGQAAMSGHPRLGARMLGAAEALGTAAGASTTGPFEPELARVREVAITAMGAAKFEAEYAAGTRLSRETALRLALGEPDEADVDAEPSMSRPGHSRSERWRWRG